MLWLLLKCFSRAVKPLVAASLSVFTGANTVTVTAKTPGVSGNDISLTVLGIPPGAGADGSLAYAETDNDMSVQLGYTAVVQAVRTLDDGMGGHLKLTFKASSVVGAAGNNVQLYTLKSTSLDVNGCRSAPSDMDIKFIDGVTTMAEVQAAINADTLSCVVASEAAGLCFWTTDSAYFSGGVDEALTSTTAQVQAIFSTSTLVNATGGSTGTASAVSHTHLSGGA